MAAPFQQIAKPHQIALDISRRVFQGIADTSLSCQIHHHLGAFLGKQCR